MAHDNDSDEVFTSVRSKPMAGDVCTCGMKFRTGEDFRDHMPCSGTDEEQRIEKWKKRCEAAEKVLGNLLEAAVPLDLSDNADRDEQLINDLVAWEGLRGDRFIYTDGCEYIVATGRGGLSEYLDTYGYEDMSDWRAMKPTETITINCDDDGHIALVGDGGTPVTKTAVEWLAKVKDNGLLCVMED
jgi:hypothetical protein